SWRQRSCGSTRSRRSAARTSRGSTPRRSSGGTRPACSRRVFAPTSRTEPGAVGARRSGRATALAVLALVLAAGLTGCEGTADSIGYDEKAGGHLRPLDMKPATYPNLFRELGRSDVEIANKIAAWFTQLFHGD